MKNNKNIAKTVKTPTKSPKDKKPDDTKSKKSDASKSKKSDASKSKKSTIVTKTVTTKTTVDNFGKIGTPTLQLTYGTVVTIACLAGLAIFINCLLAIELFSESVRIKNKLGRYIDMISKGDGAILPVFQAIPVLFCLCINVTFVYFIYKIFSPKDRPKVNFALFILIMLNCATICVTIILMFVVLGHVYGSHEHLHNGISKAMQKYSENTLYKSLLDRLQIEFQCCGSKKYDEWYNVKWFDPSLNKKSDSASPIDMAAEGHTPFSCCSVKTLSPCIHHNIESTSKSYIYTPELNLSISTTGCYTKIQEKRKVLGWKIVGNLFLFILLQLLVIIPMRLLQTAHFQCKVFVGHRRNYVGWLLGGYKNTQAPTKEKGKAPPTPPPVPPELKK